MLTHRFLCLLPLVLIAAFAFAPAAHASTTADFPDAVGDNGRSFGRGPTDVKGVHVGWDGAALTLSVTYAAPDFDDLYVLLSGWVDEEDDTTCATDAADSIEIEASAEGAELTMPYVDDGLSAEGTWSGSTVTYVFASPVLAGEMASGRDPFTCVSGVSDDDAFLGAFAGRLLKLAPADATAAVRSELTRRFGARFTGSSRTWLMCPRDEVLPADEERGAVALCQFEFHESGALYRGGDVSIELISGVPATSYFHSRTYTKRLKGCRVRRDLRSYDPMVLDRSLRASGYVGCYDGSASLVRDLHGVKPGVRSVWFHGTNRAGFDDQVSFRCKVSRRGSRYSASCANKLGDGFVYKWTLRRKAPRRPKHESAPPKQTCDPNYSGACLNPNASDYDCRGGSGNGPLYIGPVTVVGDDHYDLDGDSDGRGCEDS